MEITSRPTSSFCPPGQEQLRFACGMGGNGVHRWRESVTLIFYSLHFFVSCFGLVLCFYQLLMLFLVMPFLFAML